jgi:hypothetical protein
MDGTFLRDLEQPSSLFWGEISEELKRPVDAIEPPGFRLALRAVHSMNPGMREANDHFLQRPTLSSRVQRDRHRRSTA